MEEYNITEFDPSKLVTSSYNLVLGRRRSGKTYLVENIIKKMKDSGDITDTYLFSGSGAGFDSISKRYEIETLNRMVTNMRLINEYNKIALDEDKIIFRICIVIDDCGLKLKSRDFKIIESLAVNGRHISYEPCCCHVFVLSQSLTLISRCCRLNTDYIYINQIASAVERDLILDENFYIVDSSIAGKKKGRLLYENIIRSCPYCFVVIENCSQNIRQYSDYIKRYVAE
jgi:hypothetical protein